MFLCHRLSPIPAAEGVAYGVAERTALRTDFLSQGLAGYAEAGSTVRVQEVRASTPALNSSDSWKDRCRTN